MGTVIFLHEFVWRREGDSTREGGFSMGKHYANVADHRHPVFLQRGLRHPSLQGLVIQTSGQRGGSESQVRRRYLLHQDGECTPVFIQVRPAEERVGVSQHSLSAAAPAACAFEVTSAPLTPSRLPLAVSGRRAKIRHHLPLCSCSQGAPVVPPAPPPDPRLHR